MTTPSIDAFSRAREFLRGTLAPVVDQLEPIDKGWVARSWSLPLVWSANCVVITEPIEYADALALTEELQRELPYRQLVVEHDASGRRLAEQFGADGWEVDREVVMALTRPPDREPDTAAVIEGSEDETLELMKRWYAEDPHLDETPETQGKLREFNRRAWRARDAARLGMRDEHGSLAAMTVLYSGDGVGQVEDVYTVPEARGRGYARALVTRAVSLARERHHEFVFIIADDNDWPKQLYRKLGFDPVGHRWLFHREVKG